MNLSSSMPRLKGYRFPREIVAYAVWVYHRFARSRADVEDHLAARAALLLGEWALAGAIRKVRILPR